jgi:anhydro-N-acetylmuramic acid kinase
MSGTARMGIDAALIETDGEGFVRPIAFRTAPYTAATRELIAEACEIARCADLIHDHPTISTADQIVTALHIEAARQLISQAGLNIDQVDVVGSHGHVLAHRPGRGWSWHIGNGVMIAEGLKRLVACDFRPGNIRAGGQGAPLLPIFQKHIAAHFEKPAAILNLGGIASFTFIDAEDNMTAFDAGPGTAMLDDWTLKHTGKAYDENGALAASGHVNSMVLADLMSDPYFERPAPKSLNRDYFSVQPVAMMAAEDGAATLTAFSAQAIAGALRHLPAQPTCIYVMGRGQFNPVLMTMLEDAIGLPLVCISDDHGWNGAAIEAQGIAYLAVRRVKLLPITFPGTTGVYKPIPGGALHHPQIGGLFS